MVVNGQAGWLALQTTRECLGPPSRFGCSQSGLLSGVLALLQAKPQALRRRFDKQPLALLRHATSNFDLLPGGPCGGPMHREVRG